MPHIITAHDGFLEFHIHACTFTVVPILVDTCDSFWQSIRDNLIISSLAFALLALLILVALTVVACGRGEYMKWQIGISVEKELQLLYVWQSQVENEHYSIGEL